MYNRKSVGGKQRQNKKTKTKLTNTEKKKNKQSIFTHILQSRRRIQVETLSNLKEERSQTHPHTRKHNWFWLGRKKIVRERENASVWKAIAR